VSYIRDAAARGASLAVLPEFHLISWFPDDPRYDAIAQTAHVYISKYQALARELSINLVPGTIVTMGYISESNGVATKLPTINGTKNTPLNIAPFISNTGEILGSYTKVNVWHRERPYLTSGPESQAHFPPGVASASPHSAIQTPLGPVGILICWDISFPEAFRSLIMQGARIIIIPTFWTAYDMTAKCLEVNKNAEALFLRSALITRACENTCCIVFANAGGPEEDGYIGISQVTMPLVGPLPGSFEDSSEGLRVVPVDMSLLDVAEENYVIRQDLKRQDWHYGYSKLAT
jgi:predicted amidohydrolase